MELIVWPMCKPCQMSMGELRRWSTGKTGIWPWYVTLTAPQIMIRTPQLWASTSLSVLELCCFCSFAQCMAMVGLSTNIAIHMKYSYYLVITTTAISAWLIMATHFISKWTGLLESTICQPLNWDYKNFHSAVVSFTLTFLLVYNVFWKCFSWSEIF